MGIFREFLKAVPSILAASLCTPMLGQQSVWTADDLSKLSNPAPDFRLSYGDDALQFGELRLPSTEGPFPLVVVIHGGCWLAEYDIAHIRALADALRREGFATWAIEYRRVGDPGGGWPGTFLDVGSAIDYLEKLKNRFDLDLGRVVAVGHSAGGHLALWASARNRLSLDSPLRQEGPYVQVRGVLGLGAAPDIELLYEKKVCGHVIDALMGGPPAAFPTRYRDGSPMNLLPLGVKQILVNGVFDSSWGPVAESYYQAAQKAGDLIELRRAPESGHFEMIVPQSSTFPLVVQALQDLFESLGI